MGLLPSLLSLESLSPPSTRSSKLWSLVSASASTWSSRVFSLRALRAFMIWFEISGYMSFSSSISFYRSESISTLSWLNWLELKDLEVSAQKSSEKYCGLKAAELTFLLFALLALAFFSLLSFSSFCFLVSLLNMPPNIVFLIIFKIND